MTSPDTIIPDPYNSGDFDRYSYCQNNPINLNDPTGHFSEEAIMKFFGVKKWDDVLKFFQKGGLYEGRWGTLEILRKAEKGDKIYTAMEETLNGPLYLDENIGWFDYYDGSIIIRSIDSDNSRKDILFNAKEAVSFFAHGGLGIKGQRWYGEMRFSSGWWQKGENLQIKSNINWGTTAWDTVSLGLSLFGLGGAGKWAKGASNISSSMSGAGAFVSLVVEQDSVSTALGIGGAMPNPLISVPSSIASVLKDLFTIGP